MAERGLLTRRGFVAAGVGVGAGAASTALLAQQPPVGGATPTKGPRVWRDMDQAELDAAYDQARYAPNIQEVLKRYASASEETRQRLGPPQRFAYGDAPVEGLDVFATKRAGGGGAGAPVNVFLHGGAWRGGFAKDYAFPAELFVDAGAHYVAVDFSPVQDVGGSLAPMADQVRRAVAWVHRNAGRFGADPGRIYLSGHSSGAHLAGVVLTTDWAKDFGLPADLVKGALCCSGIYDLRPVRLSARGSYVKFTDEAEEALSPQRHLAAMNAPVIVAYGSLETPEFQRQSRDFAAALEAAGKPARLLFADGLNHFEILETFRTPDGLLGRAALEQMKLSAA